MIAQILWTLRFLKAHGYQVKANVLMQDNSSTIKMESNGRTSAGKRSRHLDIKHFYVTDQAEKGLIEIEYCPTDQMHVEYATKVLQGKLFIDHWSFMMNQSLLEESKRAVSHFESDSSDSEEEEPQDTGPTVVDEIHWSDDPSLLVKSFLIQGAQLMCCHQLHVLMEMISETRPLRCSCPPLARRFRCS